MIKVLIVDDSAVIRTMVKQILLRSSEIEVVGEAGDGQKAVHEAKILKPDVIIMDINMPTMDGLEATRQIMINSPTAILMFTTEDVARVGYQALEYGAVDIIPKPDLSKVTSVFYSFFLSKIISVAGSKSQSAAPVKKYTIPLIASNYEVFCIGASTGGPVAVQKVLKGLSSGFPVPILITQHIDKSFDHHYASWLSETSGIPVKLANDGETPLPGHAYVAPADKHMVVEKSVTDGNPVLRLTMDPPVHFLRPAVDKLFFSAADIYGKKCLAALLTGMGKDGAEGCKMIKTLGGYTIAESEETCVVFGMPKAAIDAGAVSEVVPLHDICTRVSSIIGR